MESRAISLPAISLGIYIVLSEGISLQNLDDSTITVCVLQKKTRRGNQDAMNSNISVTWRNRFFEAIQNNDWGCCSARWMFVISNLDPEIAAVAGCHQHGLLKMYIPIEQGNFPARHLSFGEYNC